MSAHTVATRDANARVTIKSQAGPVNLPEFQAKSMMIATTELVRSFTPQTTGSFSTYSEWLLAPDALPDHIDRVTLVTQLSAATATGSTYVNLVGDASWINRLIEVSIGSELLWSGYPEATYLQSILHASNESKVKTMASAGNLALATRKTNAAAGQTLALDIPIPFILKYGWLSKSHAAPLRIKVYHADLTSILATDGTAPVLSIQSLTMNVAGRSFVSQANLAAVVNTQRKLGRVDQRYLDVVQQDVALASGSASYTIQLQSLVGNFDHVMFVIRAASSVSTALGNTPDAFVACQSYNLKDSGGNLVVPEISSAYALGPLLAKFVSGDATDIASGLGVTQRKVYGMFFGSRPEEAISKGTSHGAFRMSGLEKLQIQFASALSANHIVTVIGYVQANIACDAVGTVKKSLVV